MSNGVEINGPANIILALDRLERDSGYISNLSAFQITQLKHIRKQAEQTAAYIGLLTNPNDIKWHSLTVGK